MCGHLAPQVQTPPVCQGAHRLNASLIPVHSSVTIPALCMHAKQIVFSGELWTARVHAGGRPVIYASLLYSDGENRSCLLALPTAVRRDLTKTICLAVTVHHKIASCASISCFVIFIFGVARKPKRSHLSAAHCCKRFEQSFGVWKL